MKCLPTCPGITPEIGASGVEKALKVLGGRWKPIILFYLFRDGTLRLSKLERAIPGITQKMLIQQLRSLELDGVVSRLVHSGGKSNPPGRLQRPARRRISSTFFDRLTVN
jgi:DNA-binding HxlR family transcriptional regulator